MKYIHNWKNAIIGRVALLALLLMGGISAQADTKISIEDLSIAPGETKTVNVILDNDRADLYWVEFNVTLPEGLGFAFTDEAGKRMDVSLNRTRAGRGFTVAGNTQDGHILLRSNPSNGVLPAIQGTTGTILSFKVMAGDKVPTVSTIEIKDVAVFDTNNAEVAATAEGGLVSNIQDNDVVLTFGQRSVIAAPGETVNIDVLLTNPNVDVQAFQTDVKVPAGWSFQVIESNRMYNEGQGNRIMAYTDGVDGYEGTIFTLALTAPADFAGSATIELTNASVTVNNKSKSVDGASVTVRANGDAPIPGGLAMYFASQSAFAAPGETINIPVYMNNTGYTVQAFQANLTVPTGWTYQIIDSDRMYNEGQGNRIMAYTDGIEGESGTIFTLALTAPADFTGTADIELTKASVTVSNKSKVLEDATITIQAKDPADLAAALADVQDLRDQLAAKKALIESEYPAAVNDPELVAEEEAIEAAIDALEQKINDDYAAGKLDLDEVAAEKAPIAERIEALEAAAKEIQDKDGNKDNEAGKAALDDEIAELQQKLDAAEDAIPADVPADAKKALEDEADAIQDMIDALKAEVEKDYADGKLTPDSKLDPEKKQAILDAIDALKAKIASWLRGDVDNDGDVDMADFYALKKLISEEKTPKADEDANFFYRCDANADGEINVGDLQGILNICTGLSANGK